VSKLTKLIALLILIAATPAPAAAPTTQPMFPKGAFTLSAASAYTRALDKDEADIGSAELGGNYYVWDNFSLGAEIDAYCISQPGDDAGAFSLEGTFRHHLWQHDDDWTIFLDGAFGPSYSLRDTPTGGTHFNFVTRLGVGATYRLDEHLHLMFGARYWHLSNARIEGMDRNPNFNGMQVFVGLMWQF
jgi:hypothetical protein